MIIGVYNPYFDSLGGGERYALTLASHWSKKHDVYLFWDDDSIRKKAQNRLNINLSRVKTTQNIFRRHNILKKAILSTQYDIIFFISDGSIPTSLARHNILHFQAPFPKVPFNPLKLWRYDAIVCNSFFTKKYLDHRLSQRAIVVYPPVAGFAANAEAKTKLILNVGRFTSYFQAKKQEVLIDAFRHGYKTGLLKEWKLTLIGGLVESDREYFHELQKEAHGFPISLIPNGTFNCLSSLYQKASIYWHAAGYGETDPTLAEHFGISTVEAMSAGCIPIVYRGGGQPEIVEEETSGFLWNTVDELLGKTVEVMVNSSLQQKIRRAAQKRAKNFDENKFYKAFDDLFKKKTQPSYK